MGRSWGKKDDGTYGFVKQKEKEIPNPFADRVKGKPVEINYKRLRPNYISSDDLGEIEVEQEEIIKPYIEPYFEQSDPVWQYLLRIFDAEIMVLKDRLSKRMLDNIKTESLRGEIYQLQKLKRLEERRRRGEEKHLLI